jgi:hypothetical protein
LAEIARKKKVADRKAEELKKNRSKYGYGGPPKKKAAVAKKPAPKPKADLSAT